MPIPSFNEHGLLPTGIYDCTLDEVRARFGRFQISDHRPRLWGELEAFVDELRLADIGHFLLIDGSFVTTKSNPEDIDLILVVSAEHDFSRDLAPREYNVLSAQRVRRRHRLDLLVAREESEQYRRYVGLFQEVRLAPGQRKGILRVRI